MTADLVGLSFAVEAGSAAYVPSPTPTWAHRTSSSATPYWRGSSPAGGSRTGQGRAEPQFDMSILARYGIAMAGSLTTPCSNPMCWTAPAPATNMDDLAKKYLHHDTITYADIAGSGAKQLSFDQIPLEQAGPYAAEDAEVTFRLHQALWPSSPRSRPWPASTGRSRSP